MHASEICSETFAEFKSDLMELAMTKGKKVMLLIRDAEIQMDFQEGVDLASMYASLEDVASNPCFECAAVVSLAHCKQHEKDEITKYKISPQLSLRSSHAEMLVPNLYFNKKQ